MEENSQKNHVVNHFEAGSNCQVFNGGVTGCVFALPGATVTQQTVAKEGQQADEPASTAVPGEEDDGVELFHFIHPSVPCGQERQVHNEVARLVRRQGIQEICAYLKRLADDHTLLLPQGPGAAYTELVRMGMPSGEGFNEKTFQKYYHR